MRRALPLNPPRYCPVGLLYTASLQLAPHSRGGFFPSSAAHTWPHLASATCGARRRQQSASARRDSSGRPHTPTLQARDGCESECARRDAAQCGAVPRRTFVKLPPLGSERAQRATHSVAARGSLCGGAAGGRASRVCRVCGEGAQSGALVRRGGVPGSATARPRSWPSSSAAWSREGGGRRASAWKEPFARKELGSAAECG